MRLLWNVGSLRQAAVPDKSECDGHGPYFRVVFGIEQHGRCPHGASVGGACPAGDFRDPFVVEVDACAYAVI